jgi:adenosylcobinamide-GDP ribazoletransferase
VALAIVLASAAVLGAMLLGNGPGVLQGLLVGLVPLALSGLLAVRCVKRFGGITGDVLGATIEVAFTATLLVACLV